MSSVRDSSIRDGIDVTLNGAPCRLAAGTTVGDLVRDRAGTGRGTAVAVDGEVVPRAEWPDRRLAPGQQVELIVAMQGG